MNTELNIDTPEAPGLTETPDTPETSGEPQSLRESLADAFKEARERDERGRFKAAQEAAAQPQATTPQAAAAPAAEAPQAAQQPAASKGLSWKNPASAGRWTQQAWWSSLTPEAQAAIAAREDEVHVGMTKQDEERQFARDLQKEFAPYQALLQAEGATPATAVRQLMNTAYVLRNGSSSQKAAALAEVARNYGIPLEGLGSQGQGDPAIQQLQNENLELKRKLEQIDSGIRAQSKQQVQSEIAAFASDPEHVHFEAVKADMAALLQTGRAKDLKDAYDKACWAVPEIRSTLQAEAQRKADEKRISDEKAKADAAKRKAVSVRGGPGATAPTAPGGSNSSLREQLRSALRDAQGQV